jgi:hypothetical protein
MREILIALLLIPTIIFSQEIIIKGKVTTSENGNQSVQVIKNDTLDKHREIILFGNKDANGKTYENNQDLLDISLNDFPKKQEIFNNLSKDKNYVTNTDSLNNFVIRAKLTDSLFFKSYTHITKAYLVSDLIKKKKIQIDLKLEPCDKWSLCKESPTQLYVFVGRKIKTYGVKRGHCNSSYMDSRTNAKYLILENIYGDYPKDTIEFTSYSHSSFKRNNYSPDKNKFDNYEHVLLYVLKYCNEYTQVKYLYDDIYKTKEGIWASPLNLSQHSNPKDSTFYIKPKKINFIKPIIFDYQEYHELEIKKTFPNQYNIVKNGKIEITHGFYLQDLFEIRKINRLQNYKHLIE